VPVMVTDKRPPSDAAPVTLTLSQACCVTLDVMVAPLSNWRPPPIVSCPLGVSVPSMVVPLVVVTVLLPVNVPEGYT